MRTTFVSLLLGAALIGCGGTTDMPTPGPASSDVDMAFSPGVGGGGGGGGSSGGASGDMSHSPGASTDMAHAAGGGDMAAADMAGLKPFGAPCASNAQCTTNVCFIGGMQSFCSMHCTAATAAKDCPVPPTTGACNNQGYCK